MNLNFFAFKPFILVTSIPKLVVEMGDPSSERTTILIKNWVPGICRHVTAGE